MRSASEKRIPQYAVVSVLITYYATVFNTCRHDVYDMNFVVLQLIACSENKILLIDLLQYLNKKNKYEKISKIIHTIQKCANFKISIKYKIKATFVYILSFFLMCVRVCDFDTSHLKIHTYM